MRIIISLLFLFGLSCISVMAQGSRTYQEMSEEMSKHDMETLLEGRLSEFVFSYRPSTSWKSDNVVKISSDVWVEGKGMYEEKTCRNAIFYKGPDAGSLVPVFDVSMPEESVRTLCSIDCGKTGIKVKLSYNRYGFVADKAECPIGALVGFLRSEGCVPYVQIEEINESRVVATVIMVNKEAQYNHVLKVVVPVSVIASSEGDVEVTMNTFIPVHNLNNLYSDK